MSHCCFTTFRGALQRFVARYKVFAPFAHCDALFCTALRAQIVGRPSSVQKYALHFKSSLDHPIYPSLKPVLGLITCEPVHLARSPVATIQTFRLVASCAAKQITKEEENESTRKWPTFSWGHLALQRQRRRLFQPSPLPRQVASSPRWIAALLPCTVSGSAQTDSLDWTQPRLYQATLTSLRSLAVHLVLLHRLAGKKPLADCNDQS